MAHWGRKWASFSVAGHCWGGCAVALGQVTVHWGRQWEQILRSRALLGRVRCGIGVGYGALGQVINLPQWVLTCPSRWFPAPMPRPDSERPVVEALAAGPLSQRYRTFTAMPHFASVITLAKWRYPFENSASLAKRPPRPPEGRDFSLETAASPAKQPEQPRPATCAEPVAVSVRNGAPLHLDPQQPGAAHVPVQPPIRNSWAPRPPSPTRNRQQWDSPPPCPPPPRRQQDGNNGANAPPAPPRGSS